MKMESLRHSLGGEEGVGSFGTAWHKREVLLQ